MSWLFTILLALGVLVALIALRAPRAGWEAIAATLLFGIAGYGLQGQPSQPGSPKHAAESVAGGGAELVAERQRLGGGAPGQGANQLVIADAFARAGQFGNAAEVLRGAVERNPRDGEAWLAMANALVQHSDGLLTPASLYAYRKSAEMAPGNPAPSYFLGLALAQSGRLGEAREMWAGLLAAAPADAPYRAELSEKLGRLDAFIASQQPATGAPNGPQPGP